MDKSKTDNIKIFGNALKNGVSRKAGSYLFKSTYVICLLIFMSCNSQQKNRSLKDPIPYLHELDSNSNYEVLTIIPNNYSITDPNDQHSTFHKLFFDIENKNIIVQGEHELSPDKANFLGVKISTLGEANNLEIINRIMNNGYFFRRDKYSSWIINNDSILKDFKPLLLGNEKNDIEKWMPKFLEFYNKSEYVNLSTSITEYRIFIDGEWLYMGRQEDTPLNFRNQYPAKNPPGRMMVLEDITPDFLNDTADTSLIELLGYGQEYFEEGEGMNPINGSAGHYYFALKMKHDTLKFKRFGTMHPNLWVYKIPEEFGGNPDVVFIVQEYNRMFPNQEFGGMYVVRPKGISKSKVE